MEAFLGHNSHKNTTYRWLSKCNPNRTCRNSLRKQFKFVDESQNERLQKTAYSMAANLYFSGNFSGNRMLNTNIAILGQFSQ